jgi:hypothetical protein
MRVLFILLISFAFQNFLPAQTALPKVSDKPLWNIGFWRFFENYGTGSILKLEKDTAFCGKTWIKARWSNVDGTLPDYAYYRLEGKRAFFKINTRCDQKEYLMYDFDLKVGDTLVVPVLLGETEGNEGPVKVRVRVDSISTIILGGIQRKRMVVNYVSRSTYPGNPSENRDIWIEGIGSQIFPLYPWGCVNRHLCNVALFYIRCFQLNSQIIYQDSRAPFCSNSIITSNSEPQNLNLNLNIYPNPISQGGNWQIEWAKNELKASQLDLLDPLGRVLKQMSDLDRGYMQRVQVPTENLPKGLYYLRMKDEKGQVLALEKVMVQ